MWKALTTRPELRLNSEATGKPLKGLEQVSALARILKYGISARGVQRLEVLLRIS